ncbi:hypothetical protein Q7F20_03520 [Curtobacterium sp. A7_M15]|uniref:hypothetical protein n=1 Tax=Curtobacterium sp. A7_M15 TaxID=3065241 RepID=UPI002737BF84|nr:hypothetical protein [Curtobacterium sp. A7_M15]MDP4332427.1 hypothetical protein [Curtobacterium sp. A7_M15]
MLYDPSEEAAAVNFVMSRHGGAQEGVGLPEWDSDEKDRFRVRQGGERGTKLLRPGPGLHRRARRQQRLESTDHHDLAALGLEVVNGELVTKYPADQVAKGLRKIVDDLRSQRVKSSPGIHARTGRRPLPSTGAPIASGESEYRASSGAVYRSRRRPPTFRIVEASADTGRAREDGRVSAMHRRQAFIAPANFPGDSVDGARTVARTHGWITADHGEGARRLGDFCPEHAVANAIWRAGR